MTRELTDTTESAAAAERGLVEDARRRILDLIGNQTLQPGDRVGTERELVVDLVRIRLADRVPLSLERAQLPAGLFPGLLELPLGGSLYELLDSHYGIRPEDVIEHLEVVEAGPEDAALLGIGTGAPLLAVTRTSSTSDGVPFEHSLDLFRADRTRVTFRTRAERAEIRRSDAGKWAPDLQAVDRR